MDPKKMQGKENGLIQERMFSHPDLREQSKLELPIDEFEADVTESDEIFRGLFDVNYKRRRVVLTPKKEAFGLIKIGRRIVSIYPKIISAHSENVHVLTKLLFLNPANPKPNFKRFFKVKLDKDRFGDNIYEYYFFIQLSRLQRSLKEFSTKASVSQEVSSEAIKGRISFSKTLAKYPGLPHKHVQDILDLRHLDLFYSLINMYLTDLERVLVSAHCRKLISTIRRVLPPKTGIKLQRYEILKLNAVLRKERFLSSELKECALEILEYYTSVGSFNISSAGLTVNMNRQFEWLSYLLAKEFFEGDGTDVLNGNSGSGLKIESLSAESGEGILKRDLDLYPDIIIKKDKEIAKLIDAKYKYIDFAGTTIKDVISADLYQMFSYWLFFQDSVGEKDLEIGLIYPYPGFEQDRPLVNEGKIVYPTRIGSQIKIQIWRLDIGKAIKYLEGDMSEQATGIAAV